MNITKSPTVCNLSRSQVSDFGQNPLFLPPPGNFFLVFRQMLWPNVEMCSILAPSAKIFVLFGLKTSKIDQELQENKKIAQIMQNRVLLQIYLFVCSWFSSPQGEFFPPPGIQFKSIRQMSRYPSTLHKLSAHTPLPRRHPGITVWESVIFSSILYF